MGFRSRPAGKPVDLSLCLDHSKVAAGLPARLFFEVEAQVGIAAAEARGLFGVSPSTRKRLKAAAPTGQRLDTLVSDRVARLAVVWIGACRALGDAAAARTWLREPLGAASRLYLVTTEPGMVQVRRELDALERRRVDLDALRRAFDIQFERMQTPEARAAVDDVLGMSGEALGRAAVGKLDKSA